MTVRPVEDKGEKKRIASAVLSDLPEWFGIPESTAAYIEKAAEQTFFAAFDGGAAIGFMALKATGRDTCEIAVCGVLKKRRGAGVGKALFEKASSFARESGFGFIQVKTVVQGKYPEYDETNGFYKSLGFREFELMPELWGKENPCQIYVMAL